MIYYIQWLAPYMYRCIRAVFPAWEEARLACFDEAAALAYARTSDLVPPNQSSVPTSTNVRLAVLQATANVALCHAMILEMAGNSGPVDLAPWPDLTDDERYYLAMWMTTNPTCRAALVLHRGLEESKEDVQRMLGETWTSDARNSFFYRAHQEFKSNFDWVRRSPSCGCPRTLCSCLADVRFTEETETGLPLIQSPEQIEGTFGTLASSLYWLRKERTHVKR